MERQTENQRQNTYGIEKSVADALQSKLLELGAEVIQKQTTASKHSKTVPLDIVTESDLLVERELKKFIGEHRPDDGFLGEEKSSSVSKSGVTWYTDPIDGTLNYSRGDDNYSLSIGCAYQDTPIFGAVYFPRRKELFISHAGSGAFLNDAPLEVTPKEKSLKELCGEFCMMRTDLRLKELRYLLDQNVGYLFSYASATYASSRVALGNMDFFVHTSPTVFDYGAIALIAKESGCYVAQDFSGTPVKYQNGPTQLVICRTERIAKQLGELVAKVG